MASPQFLLQRVSGLGVGVVVLGLHAGSGAGCVAEVSGLGEVNNISA